MAKNDESGAGTIARAMPTAVGRLIQLMSGRAEIDATEGGSESASYDAINAILTADSAEDMWSADEAGGIGGRDLAGIVQRVIRFDVKYGNQEMEGKSPFVDSQGKRMYLLVDAVRLSERRGKNDHGPVTGEMFQWNTSAPRLVAKLFWLEQHDMLPADVVITSTDLGGGQAVLKLQPAAQLAQVG